MFFLNADGAIYGRYGSRAANYGGDISIAGFKKALQGALDLHAAYPANKEALAGKMGARPRWPKPELIPTLMHKKAFDTSRGGCIHCHEIHDGELESLRKGGVALSDALLWYYPMPDAVGLEMDVNEMATVKRVVDDSVAEKSGFRAGDKILRLEGQPLLSIADLQWVLHNAKAPTKLVAEVERDEKMLELTLPLEPDWRRGEDFTWRSHTWYLRQGIAGFFV
ncbi:PDZ domain-containing protein, partial [Candidatus Poribacteria bacterium]|nr:PDZ domain-containing protein [Candidatus Poribacteria bacterium]